LITSQVVRPELAILGFDHRAAQALRWLTLGNPTLPKDPISNAVLCSQTATQFLERVKAHPSKASAGYYFRYFDTYFRMLESSFREMTRAVKSRASAFIVLQDSCYKELRLDLPRVAVEIGERHGWRLKRQFDFPIDRTMAAINPRARAHRQDFGATESVLFLRGPSVRERLA